MRILPLHSPLCCRHWSKPVTCAILKGKLTYFSSLSHVIRLYIKTLISYPTQSWPLHVIQNKEKCITVDKWILCIFFLPGIVSKFFEICWVCRVLWIINEKYTYEITNFRNYVLDCQSIVLDCYLFLTFFNCVLTVYCRFKNMK